MVLSPAFGDVQLHARKHMQCNLVPMFLSARWSIIQHKFNIPPHTIYLELLNFSRIMSNTPRMSKLCFRSLLLAGYRFYPRVIPQFLSSTMKTWKDSASVRDDRLTVRLKVLVDLVRPAWTDCQSMVTLLPVLFLSAESMAGR